MFKRTLGPILLLAVTTTILAIGSMPLMAKKKTLYTAHNFWYEKPHRIPFTGYHAGTMIPAGTEIKVVFQDKLGVQIKTVADKKKYSLKWKQHHNPHVSRKMLLARFVTEKPFEELTAGFTEEEIAAIKEGKVTLGMSKAAVLVSQGYPPSHRTVSIEESTWKYWYDKYRNYLVIFGEDGKVVDLENPPAW